MARKKRTRTRPRKRARARTSSHSIARYSAPSVGISRRRRSGGGGGGGALLPKDMMGALLAAAALGVAEARGVSIPHIGSVGEAGTLALVAFGLDKFGIVRSPILRNAAVGLGSIAVYDLAKKLGESKASGGHVAAYEVR